jgi:prepilin-type N-terminal cleavage/methylation domain-containing protein
MKRNGFSLIELSIVLVIMGLIVGGVMAGSSLIRNAEVKSVITEFTQYRDAALTFRTKYGALPGDLPDAGNYWSGAVSGNGDGVLDVAALAGATAEFAQFWRHLSLAGLAEGEYTGLAGGNGVRHMIAGTNIPRATLTNAAWGTFTQGTYAGDASNFAYEYGNVIALGGETTNNWNWTPVLKPEEAWNIDMKIDDGMPGAGTIVSLNRTTCAASTAVNDYTASYRLDNTATVCGFYFTNAYN